MLDINPKSESRKEYCIEFYESLKTELKESHPDFDYQSYLIKGDEYLTNYNKSALKEMSASEIKEYNLFASGLQMQDLTQFGDTLGLSTTNEIGRASCRERV